MVICIQLTVGIEPHPVYTNVASQIGKMFRPFLLPASLGLWQMDHKIQLTTYVALGQTFPLLCPILS